MKRVSVGVLTLVVGVAVVGCAAPGAEEFADRFLVEYATELEYPVDLVRSAAVTTELAAALAEAAADGACGDETYYGSLEADVEDAFGVTCSMFFEGDMSGARLDRAKQSVADRVEEPDTRG